MADMELHDSKFPFHHIVTAYEALEDEQWEALYGTGGLEEVIAAQVEIAKNGRRAASLTLQHLIWFKARHRRKYIMLCSVMYSLIYIAFWGKSIRDLLKIIS